MLLEQVNRTDPEKVFAVFTNSFAGTLVNGDLLEWDVSGAAATLGVNCTKSQTLRGPRVCGVCATPFTVNTSAIGFMQIYGYHSAVKTTTTVTVSTVVPICADTSGKAVNYTASTTSLSATGTAEVRSIIGFAATVNDTNSSGILLRLM